MDERMSNRRTGSDDGQSGHGDTPGTGTPQEEGRDELGLDRSESTRFRQLVDTIERHTWERSAIGDADRESKRALLAADEDS